MLKMNEIFKYFKKRSQSGKQTNLTDVLDDKEFQNMTATNSNFDRNNRSYISISKSGRLKSKKSHQTNRVLKEDLFVPISQNNQTINTTNNNNNNNNNATNNNNNSANSNSSTANRLSAGTQSVLISNKTTNRVNLYASKQPIYDPHSDNADSSRTSSASNSFQSSMEDINWEEQQKQQQQQQSRNTISYGSKSYRH